MFDRGLTLTWRAVRRQLAAMPHELYLVRLIHGVTKRPYPGERLWTPTQLMSLATLGFLRVRASQSRDPLQAGETRLGRLFGKSLVVVQVALPVGLLSAAGLFIGHLSNLERLDLGFRRDHVFLVTLDPARSGYSGEQLSRAYRGLLARLETIPGVRSASISAPTPISGAGATRFATVEVIRKGPRSAGTFPSWVAPKYFETFRDPAVGLFGALGSLLAAIGIYGLLAYTVARRIHEIGIRMALGATRGAVSRMVLGDALAMSCGGLGIGVIVVYGGRRLAGSLIRDLPVTSAFPIVFGAVATIAITLVAVYVPARRAAKVDPMEALRYE
jgi:hypothetical protein